MRDAPPTTPSAPAERPASAAAWLAAAGRFLTVVLLQGGEAALLLATLFVAARWLGAEAAGQYVYAVDCGGLALLGALFGFELSSVRYVSAAAAHGDWGRVRAFLRFAYAVIAVTAPFAMAVMYAVGMAVGGWENQGLSTALGLAALAVPLHAVHQVHAGVLRGVGHELTARALRLVTPSLVFATLLGAGVWFGAATITPARLLTVTLAACLFAAVLSSVVLWRCLARRSHATASWDTRTWLRTTATLAVISGVMVIQTRLDTVLVTSLRGEAAAGVYALAVRTSMVLVLVLTSINYLLAPRCAKLFALGRREEMQRLVQRCAMLSLATALPLMGLLVVFGRQLLSCLGPEFSAAYGPMLVLTLGYLGIAASGPVGVVATMTNNEHALAKIQALCVVANVGLNLLAIPAFGLIGAATATAAVTIAGRFVMSWAVWRSAGIVTIPLPVRVTPPAGDAAAWPRSAPAAWP